jgi:hypothetical protein
VTFLFKTEDKTVDSVETLVRVYQTKGFIAGLYPPNPRHFAWQLPARFSRTWRSSCLGYVITTATSADQYWHLHRSDCRNTLIHAHTTSRALPTCDITLGWLTLPAPETGKLYVTNPAIHPRQLWYYYSMWWEPQMPYSEVSTYTEQVGMAVPLYTCIREISGSNLDWHTVHTDWELSCFFSFSPGKFIDSTSLRRRPVPSDSFPLNFFVILPCL